MDIYTNEATPTLITTINAQTATSIVGSFEDMAQFSFTQTSLESRNALKAYFVKTNTSPTELNYEDGTIEEYYLGASYARSDGKIVQGYWYGSEIDGTGKLTEICGLFFVSGDTGKMDTSSGSAAAAPIQLFPIKALEETTLTKWDKDYTTTTTATLEAGQATLENQGTVPTPES